VVRALFEEFPGHDLAGFIIWVPMLPLDNAATAQFEQDAITDPRLRFWFDHDKEGANAWSSFVGYPGTIWDVYAIYDESAVWSDEVPPVPRIWMHQLNETPATRLADRLDVPRLARGWLELLSDRRASGPHLDLILDQRGRAVSQRADSGLPRL
jgi:hypothetical protein